MTVTPLEDLVLGVAEIDDDHAATIADWKAARDAATGEFPARLVALVDRLADHFAREEALMRRIGYGEIAHHVADHVRVIGDGRRFVAQASAGRTQMARAWVVEMVPEWFRRHVTMFDAEVARVAEGAGVV